MRLLVIDDIIANLSTEINWKTKIQRIANWTNLMILNKICRKNINDQLHNGPCKVFINIFHGNAKGYKGGEVHQSSTTFITWLKSSYFCGHHLFAVLQWWWLLLWEERQCGKRPLLCATANVENVGWPPDRTKFEPREIKRELVLLKHNLADESVFT